MGGTPTYVRKTVDRGNICEIKLKTVKSELFQMVYFLKYIFKHAFYTSKYKHFDI